MPRLDGAAAGLRPLIQDLDVDNIADLATRAASLDDVIRLWYGEGDLVTPDFVREAAKAALDEGRTFYEPGMRGAPALTQALSAYQTRLHGREIGVDRSTVTPGGMHAVQLACLLTMEAGTNAVYVEPQWPNIRRSIFMAGAEPRPVALDQTEQGWRLDLDRLFAACDARTRAIVYSSPSNPCGWTASEDELRALLEFSQRTGVWIVADEVYARLWWGGGACAPSILRLAEPEDRVITVNSFSKAWAMTGWRVGWLTHPPSVQPTLGAVTQYANSGTAPFVQAGAAAALTEGEATAAAIRDRCRAGAEAAWAALGGLNSLRMGPKPAGGMYAFFRVEGVEDSREACRDLLERARVGLAPGFMFGESARAHLRLCVCRDTGQIEEACRRIAAALGGAER